MHIPVCLASDRAYLQHLAVTMASILKNKAESDHIRFYILENTLTDEDRQLLLQLRSIAAFDIEYVDPGMQDFEIMPFHDNDRFTITSYFRLFIPELIPQEDKIIYLDCDIVVNSSLSGLYKMDMESNHILGVRDVFYKLHQKRLSVKRYINAGVLLMDSKQMREDKVVDEFREYIRNNFDKIICHDQDVISAVLHDRMQYISNSWNLQLLYTSARKAWTDAIAARKDLFVIHYIGPIKPWHPDYDKVLGDLYFKYLRLTPFAGFEKPYRKQRRFWKLSKLPSRIWRFVKSKESSRFQTYETYYYFGIPVYRKKRESNNTK